MNWDRGFSAAYYAAVVDPVTWRDISRVEITGGSISRTDSGLRGSADIDCVNYEQGRERWLRIWLNARQGGDTVHVHLFTGLASSPEKKINGTLITNDVRLYSVLKPAEDILLPRGWYAPERTNGGTIIKDLFSVIPAPVEIEEDTPVILENIIAENGENRLSMAEKILQTIGWRLRISGDGIIRVCRRASDTSGTFDSLRNDIIEPQIDVEYDWYSCPNVFRAVSGDETATAYDDSEDSVLSVVSRGREVWMEDTSCKLNDGESIGDYARRRLAEEQQISCKIKYKRRYDPFILPSDLVRLNYPAQELKGTFYIQSQSINLGYGATTSEEAVKYERY